MKNQETQTTRTKLYFMLGAILVLLLIVGFVLRSQKALQPAATSNPAHATLQINLPTVQYPTIPPSAPDFSVSIQSVGDSGISGEAAFKDIAGNVAILLRIEGLTQDEASESILPVELHHGTCAAPGDLAYPMTAPDAGQSETDLPMKLKEFNTQKPMAIVVYRSLDDRSVIACGDVP